MNNDHWTSVLVFFSGNTDKTILSDLGINGYPMFNVICYDTNNNHNFDVQLFNFQTKQIIFSAPVKFFKKDGKLTNLIETYILMCTKQHKNLNYANHPCTDNINTKFIFDKIVRKMGFQNIIKY